MHDGPNGARTARRGSHRLALSFLILLVAALAAAPVPAAASTIKILVNNEPITSYAIGQRAALIKLTARTPNPARAAEDELINEAIQLQEAKRMRVRISDAEVDRAIAGIAERIGISVTQLNGALRQQGVNPETLRQRIYAQLAWGRVLQARFQATSQVTEQDLVAALREKGADIAKETNEYRLEQVIAVVPARASGAEKSAAQSRANDLRNRFSGCEAGLELARSTREVVVRPFGRRLETELAPRLVEALKGVEVGRLSPPIEQPEGLVMFAVCEKKTVRSTAAAMAAIEEDMRNQRGEQFAMQYLRKLRRDALIERR